MSATILWTDDEIDLLKPHILFLENKGYRVLTASSGSEALDLVSDNEIDIIFLDENMPGLSGIETLERLKSQASGIPVVMITKSEEESVMNDAIGSSIADYLIKPVNPNQILLSLKKNLDNRKLVSEKTGMIYQQQFRQIGSSLSPSLSFEEWVDIYRQLVYWELELAKADDESLYEIFLMQKAEANNVFARFVENNYEDWLKGRSDEKPVLSHTLFREKCLPILKEQKQVFLILIDNLRLDQWKTIQPKIETLFRTAEEDTYCSILPTATQYARNALFSGLMPGELYKRFPKYWTKESDEGTRNQFESELLAEQLKRLGSNIPFHYHKILNLTAGKKLASSLSDHLGQKLNVLVYNFVDMLSHSRTDMEVIKELADDEAAYRSITLSWFEHSPLWEIMRQLAEKQIPVIITTDHGAIRVQHPTKIVGDRNTNTNLRYKTGKSLQYKKGEVFEVNNPDDIFLPRESVSANYVFAKENRFFAYPNNFNYYVNYYRDTFQHGGVSLEEMLIPFAFMTPK